MQPSRLFLCCEAIAIFLVLPLALFLHPTRLDVHLSMWAIAAYAIYVLHKTPGFLWRQEWAGRIGADGGWSKRDFYVVALRFIISTLGIVLLTALIRPERLFAFPRERPIFWLLIMVLYPILSALPQEVIFRSFFLRRYAPLFSRQWVLLAVNAFLFGFIHIVFHNPVSPILSLLCGFFLATSYLRHGSLKKAAIEHALYGDMVFTIGLGYYFLVGYSN